MKNKKLFLFGAVIILLPFIILFILHTAYSLKDYFRTTLLNIGIKDWLMFFGSYLGGIMTLVGVVMTIKYEINLHNYERIIENIEKEKEAIGEAICAFNLLLPGTLFLQVSETLVGIININVLELIPIRIRVNEEMNKLLSARSKLEFYTDIYFVAGVCTTCERYCKLKESAALFIEDYELVGNKLYNTLNTINNYIIAIECNRNDGYTQKMIDEIKPYQDEINAAIKTISEFNQKEILQLKNLGRKYIEQKKLNAYSDCFRINKK